MMDFFINAALYLMVFGFPVLVLAWALMNGMEAFIDFIDKETLFMSQTVDSATGNGKLYYLTRTERGKTIARPWIDMRHLADFFTTGNT